jgi:glycosyltransferase involved in cell wall biosynthesis
MYAYHPPLTVGIAGALIRLFRRVPLVLDIQDVWPDSLQSTGMIRSRGVLKKIGWLCDLVYRMADQIVVLSPGFKRLLIDRGVHASKLKVIFNWADENARVHDEMFTRPDNFPKRESFVVLFAGNMGSAQALESAVEAAAKLERSGESVDFVFLGTGVRIAALKSLAASLRLSNVHFLPPVPMSQVGAYLAAADTLLVHLRRDPLFEITIPSKTQAYLAAGRPIVMAVLGDAAHIIDRSGGGVTATPEDPESLVHAVRKVMSMDPVGRLIMGRRGRAFYKSQLSMKSGVDSFAILFRSLISANESGSRTAR